MCSFVFSGCRQNKAKFVLKLSNGLFIRSQWARACSWMDIRVRFGVIAAGRIPLNCLKYFSDANRNGPNSKESTQFFRDNNDKFRKLRRFLCTTKC